MDNSILDEISHHTEMKIELINKYVESWAYKILQYPGKKVNSKNEGLVFIDCMSNAGMYRRKGTDYLVEGTALRVIRTLGPIMEKNPNKKALLFFNDICSNKIEYLENCAKRINYKNIEVNTSVLDKNVFLDKFPIKKYTNYQILLIYDPYKTDIYWNGIAPFFNVWGEVIINHMLYDVTLGIKNVKNNQAIRRYEESYQMSKNEIEEIHKDREKLNSRIIQLIKEKRLRKGEYYISYASFFNKTRGEVYRLIHCSPSLEGIKLYKKCAWKTFDDKSSEKGLNKADGQLQMDFENESIDYRETEENCFTVLDIAKYICTKFKSRKKVEKKTVYADLDKHPVFPSEGYKRNIEKALKDMYGVKVTKTEFIFNDNTAAIFG